MLPLTIGTEPHNALISADLPEPFDPMIAQCWSSRISQHNPSNRTLSCQRSAISFNEMNGFANYDLFQFSGRSERTAAPARHISDSRISRNSASNFTR